ncbi:MAG TPA: MBL fold metallo-hydrolase, partial [Tepidisphaeraceae bacterium]|nr:MBL fold metallo-hydrolase [Tepidisphaeraceae bacterium]
MSLSLCVLASGSSGNCSVIRAPGGVMLIDCGIGPRTAAGRLKGTGVHVNDIAAICLTHLDRDHFNLNWVDTVIRNQVRVFCAADRADDLRRFVDDEDFAQRIEPFNGDVFEPLPGVSVSSQPLAHDQTGSHAFVVEADGARMGYATDLGRVPAELIERFCGVDLLAIESNYDPQMQQTSGRPRFLQQRIMGGRGHLSNDQALAAVRAVLDRCQRHAHRLPRHIVLLHRSRQCNCPDLVRGLFSRDGRIASRLVLSEQFFRTPWLSAEPVRQWMGEQL